jgi:HSP20 family protein
MLPLSSDVREDQVNASFKNGVLTVTLPKSPESMQKIKRIPIKTH